jgi:hypothetical protein
MNRPHSEASEDRGRTRKKTTVIQQTDCRNYAYAHGIDKPEIVAWRWPY